MTLRFFGVAAETVVSWLKSWFASFSGRETGAALCTLHWELSVHKHVSEFSKT